IAEFGDKSDPSFLLCSHFDTKTFDTFRFVGANDGGSSNGVLIELGRVLAEQPDLAAEIELVFFDGVEAFQHFPNAEGDKGTRPFARDLATGKKGPQFRGGIFFDMVGDLSLNIPLPPNPPPEIARGIFASADALKLRTYFTYFQADITDDH